MSGKSKRNGDRPGVSLRLADIVRRHLRNGAVVEIEGLGTFRPSSGLHDDGFVFDPEIRPSVFLAYVEEDLPLARNLYKHLEKNGFRSWLDKEALLPGQNWPRSIERAIEVSDFFIACFSRRAETKRGHFHSELRYALECAQRVPLEDVYMIPIRFDDCVVPRLIRQRIQCVDLFPDWERGVERVARIIARQSKATRKGRLRLAG